MEIYVKNNKGQLEETTLYDVLETAFNTFIATLIGSTIGLTIGVVGIVLLNYL